MYRYFPQGHFKGHRVSEVRYENNNMQHSICITLDINPNIEYSQNLFAKRLATIFCGECTTVITFMKETAVKFCIDIHEDLPF